jgi:hypothetical protein
MLAEERVTDWAWALAMPANGASRIRRSVTPPSVRSREQVRIISYLLYNSDTFSTVHDVFSDGHPRSPYGRWKAETFLLSMGFDV